MNIEKMRKHSDNSMPDSMSWTFDPLDGDELIQREISWFGQKMTRKYNPMCRLDVFSEVDMEINKVRISAYVRFPAPMDHMHMEFKAGEISPNDVRRALGYGRVTII